jgi:hypothetical protein
MQQTLSSVVGHYHLVDVGVTVGLGTAGGGIGSWRGLAAALGERLFMGLDSAQLYADALLGELGTEVTLWRPSEAAAAASLPRVQLPVC